MKVRIDDIKVNGRMRKVKQEKVKEIAESIKEVGLLTPICINQNNELVAGLHRIEAVKILGWADIECNVVSFDSEMKQKLAEIDENLKRSDLDVFEHSKWVAERKRIYEELYPETRKGMFGGKGNNKQANVSADSAFTMPSFTETTSNLTGQSKRTIETEIQIANNIPDEVGELISGTELANRKTDLLELSRLPKEKQIVVVKKLQETRKKSVDEVMRQIKKEEKKEAVKIKEQEYQAVISTVNDFDVDIFNTDKKFNIIYADPAWQYWDGGEKNQSLHYQTMTIDEIKNLPVKDISASDCILFIWVTFPILKEAFDVIDAWGFKYSTCGFNWVKRNKNADGFFFGNGAWTRANSELCLIATKGSVTRIDASISQVLDDRIMEHSQKPKRVRNLITQLVGELPRIELFSRNEEKDGWFNWGNKI